MQQGDLMTRIAVAALLLGIAAGASPGRGEEAKPVPIRVAPTVQVADDHVAVTVQGSASLPDGARLHLLLLPVATPGETAAPLHTAYAEVKAGAYAASPWRVKRSDIKAPLYRLEARVAADQPPELRRSLQKARTWVVSVDLTLESWRERCRRVTPQAQLLLERLAVVTRHRDDLLAMARRSIEQKLSAADWKAWPGRASYAQARGRCVDALNDPGSVSLMPRSCDKGVFIVSVFDGIVGSIQQTLPGVEGRGNPEFKAILSIAEKEIPPDYLVEFQRVLAREGACQFAGMLRESVAELDPGTAEKPRTLAPDRLAAAQRDIRLVLDQITLFFSMPWAEEATAPRATLVESLEQASRLLDESKTAGDADSQSRRAVLWAELRTKLERLVVSLR
jgi:hypothetical protein